MIPKLNKYKIDPVLRILLHMVCTNNIITTTKNTHTDIDWRPHMKLIHHQGEIRWIQVLYGRFASERINGRHRYEYTSKRGFSNDPKWLRQLIHEIWTFAAKDGQTETRHLSATQQRNQGALCQSKQYDGDQVHALSTSAVSLGTMLPITNNAIACIFPTTHQVLYNITQMSAPKQATRHKTLLQCNKNHKTTPTPTTTQKKAAEDETRTSCNTRYKNIPANTTYKNSKKPTRLNYEILYRPR
eukprot:15063957-Ditylum_brightwellii.AAC.1